MKIGRKIFYDLETGNVIVDTGERQGYVKPTSVERDIATYRVLLERNRETFDVIELEYGLYAQDFAECNGYRVNIDIISELPFEERYKALEFSYPDPNLPPEEQELVYQKPLSEQIEDVRLDMARSNAEIFETMVTLLGGM